MHSPFRPMAVAFLMLAAFLSSQAPALAAEMLVGNIRVLKVQGASAELVNSAGKTMPVKAGTFLQQGARINTGADSSVDLVFENGTRINIAPSSTFSVEEFVQDPFSKDNLDYKSVDKAPTRSVTKISVPDGEIVFDVAKLKPGSTFDITTPLGVAGIRGTSGIAGRASFALVTGRASFQGPSGLPVIVGPNLAYSPGAPGGISSLPPAVAQSITATTNSMPATIPANTFGGAPPNVTPQQFVAIQTAVAQGGESVAAVAAALAGESPQAAADIAAAAAYAAPDAAATIAGSVAKSVPNAATSIARSVAKTVPAAQTSIATAVSNAAPNAGADNVNQAAAQGAAEGNAAAQGQPTTPQTTQPVNTGDQGASTEGQSLPSATSSSTGSGTGGNPARPNPSSQ